VCKFPVRSRRFAAGLSFSRCILLVMPLFTALMSARSASAAVPPVVVDAQGVVLPYLRQPHSVAATPPWVQSQTLYVADASYNEIFVIAGGYGSPLSTGSYTLVAPTAVAVDSAGDLFIGDSPSAGTGRVLEAMATNGVMNGTVNLIVSGAPLQEVTALTVDTNPASSTFNTLYIGDGISNAIYTVAPGATTAVSLSLTGLPSRILPSALAKDSAGNLFIADLNTTLYEVPSGTTAAETYVASGFILNSPTGLAFESKRGPLHPHAGSSLWD
jgi:hypothetical protein